MGILLLVSEDTLQVRLFSDVWAVLPNLQVMLFNHPSLIARLIHFCCKLGADGKHFFAEITDLGL